MGELIAELLLEIGMWLLEIVIRALLLPAMLIVSTPLIWIMSIFGDDKYMDNMIRWYARVVEVWAWLMEL